MTEEKKIQEKLKQLEEREKKLLEKSINSNEKENVEEIKEIYILNIY